MTNDTKKILLEKLEDYLTRNKMPASKFSSLSTVPENYISAMRNGKDFVMAGDKKVAIALRYYKLIAKHIGFKLEKDYWKTKQTPQFFQILSYLEDAQEYGYTYVLIGETGCGKTYVSDMFAKHNVQEVFKVTVGSMDTISDLLDKTCEVLKIDTGVSKSRKIREIINKLEDMRLDGYMPVLMFDEAEYMKQATLCNMKELTDHLKGKAAIVLIGTDQLVKKIEMLRTKNKDGIPQFYSRIRLGIRHIRAIDRNYPDFAEEVTDKDLFKFLQSFCNDYRQIHDLLVPAMREADRLKVPVTLELVKRFHNLP